MKPDEYDSKETSGRLQKLLRGAFNGPPTPLKNIPKKNGESRTGKEQSDKEKTKRRRKRARNVP
jgi:hypothetical protein